MAMQQMFLGIPSASAAGSSIVSAVSFDGSGDYLEVAKSTDFDFGTGAFTMEAWVYANSLTTDSSEYSALDSIFESIDWNSQDGQYSFGISHENKPYFYIFDQSNTFYYGTTVLSTQQWYHLAVSRDGSGNIRLFVNGALESTNSNSYSLSNSNQPNPARIGGCKIGNPGSGVIQKSFDGYISNLRVLKGKALYLSNFVEPNQQLEDINNTVLLCCNGSSATDATVSPASLNSNGNPTAQSESVNGFTTGTIDFDGSGDFLNTSGGSDFDFGSGDFTVEAWIRPTNATQTDPSMVSLWNFPQGRRSWGIFGNTGGSPSSYNGAVRGTVSPDGQFATRTEITGTLTLNSWNHVAFTRSGNTLYFFINGNSQGTASYTGSVYSNTQDSVMVGAMGNPSDPRNDFNGKISNVRVIKGTALYTSNFTSPTAPLTEVTNTKLLCCQDSSSTTGAAVSPTSITAKGDAASQETVVPSSWDGGYGSVFFDGDADSVSHAATGDYNLDGDWCIECWVNSTDVSLTSGLYKRIWSLARTSNNSDALYQGLCGSWEDVFNAAGDGQFKLRIDDNVTLTSSTIASDGNWHHFVVQRGGSTISLHVDGVLEATTSYSSNVNYSVNTFKIGEHHVYMNGVAGYYSSFPGKISNFRFVNGSTVYPVGASFTVPTEPLKAITNTVLLSCNDPSNAESGTAGPVISKGGNAVHDTSHPF